MKNNQIELLLIKNNYKLDFFLNFIDLKHRFW